MELVDLCSITFMLLLFRKQTPFPYYRKHPLNTLRTIFIIRSRQTIKSIKLFVKAPADWNIVWFKVDAGHSFTRFVEITCNDGSLFIPTLVTSTTRRFWEDGLLSSKCFRYGKSHYVTRLG